jgi:hypothetical protein
MRKQFLGRQVMALFASLALMTCAYAQALYKYTDKDGKVTYSDKAPKQGEKAELVNTDKSPDKNANTVKLETKDGAGVQQKFSDVKARGDARIAAREKLQLDVTNAEQQLEKAKKALAEGRDPKPGEQRIVVRQGGNSVLRTEAYYTRITGLEQSIKKAEEALSAAQERYRRGAPE